VKYDLERLGPFGFQDLCAALALRVFGATVRPMGPGRDGGRDMLTTDPVRWSGDTVWSGTTVFQVKHQAPLRGPSDATTLARSILTELAAWASPDSERGDVPEQLVFVSNVFLSAVPGSGGLAAVTKKIEDWLQALGDASAEDHLDGNDKRAARNEREARRDRMARLRAWRILDGNHLTGLLDAYQDVRRAVDGFLQAGDVLADLARFSGVLSDGELAPALKQHARWALTNERKIYFDDAGAETKGFPVEEVVIDLPVRVRGTDARNKVIRHVLDRGDRVLRPSLAAVDKPRHLVVVGAPGNGKTTVSRFLVHAYRAAWLGEDVDLGDEHRKAVTATATALGSMARRPPAHRRWPLRVDLAQFAVEKATDADFTLLTFMAQTLSKQAAANRVTKAVLAQWLKEWPCFLILDGLDEVTEPSVRKGLIADVEAFVDQAESDDHDLLAVVTTRPTGYSDDLSTSVFEHIDLDDLPLADALEYGRRVTQVRVPDDSARRDGVMSLLQTASREESLQRLLRTPLQVLIMTIIAESAREFAPSRYGLFWGYYKTIEQRERNKPLAFSSLIRDHGAEVLDLHRRAGLLLQRRAETATGADSVLVTADLRDIAWQVLSDAGYKPSEDDAPLLDKIVTAATQRLVLLTPQHDGGLGFDVRSLQELMAALAVTTGTLEDAVPRLRRISPSPHWRNTFLFAAGRYFSEPQPHQKQAVTDLVLNLDQDAPERLGAIFPVGPQLAAEMIDDGMASEPRYLHRLIGHALSALHHPEAFNEATYTRTLMSAAEAGQTARGLVADGLRKALGSTSVPRKAAERVLQQIGVLGAQTPTKPGVLALTAVKRDPSRGLPGEPTADWGALQETLTGFAEPETQTVLGLIGPLLQQVAAAPTRPPAKWDEDLQVYLSDGDVATIVEEALRHVAEAEPLLIARIRHSVMTTLWRQPLDPFL
jgi:hypothetical protein